jgi:hypothetical protein
MLANVSNLSPDEVLNYIEMPAVAASTLNDLIIQVTELETTIESLENIQGDLETYYNALEDIINQPRVNYDNIIAELTQLSNRMYMSI